MPHHEQNGNAGRRAPGSARTRGSHRARSGPGGAAYAGAACHDRPGKHDRNGSFPRKRYFCKAGGAGGDPEFCWRGLHCFDDDVGAGGDGRGAPRGGIVWTLRRDVPASVGRICDSPDVLAVHDGASRQRSRGRIDLLQILVPGNPVVDLDWLVFAGDSLCQLHERWEAWNVRILALDGQGSDYRCFLDLGSRAAIRRGISEGRLCKLHGTWRFSSEWVEWRRAVRYFGTFQFLWN